MLKKRLRNTLQQLANGVFAHPANVVENLETDDAVVDLVAFLPYLKRKPFHEA